MTVPGPGVRRVSLGDTILRAETAAMYALATWNAFCGARWAGSLKESGKSSS